MIKYIIAAIAINSFANEGELREKFDAIIKNSQVFIVPNKIPILMQRKNDLEKIRESCLKQIFENEKTQQPLKDLLETIEIYEKKPYFFNLKLQLLINAKTNHLEFIRFYNNMLSGTHSFCGRHFNENLSIKDSNIFTEQLDNVCIKIDDEGTTIILHHKF